MIKHFYCLIKPRTLRLCTTFQQIHTTTHLKQQNKENDNSNERQLIIHMFHNINDKTKTSYLDMIDIFKNKSIRRRNHCEFIYSALKHMKEFGVEKDLEVYKKLINILPKGKFIPTNLFQAEFMHYPKQQQCAIDLLEQMENNGVIPDPEFQKILESIFGKYAHPVRKYMRMLYWMPKFKNLTPWPLPEKLPNESLELAKIALKRINSVDLQSKISIYKSSDLKDSLDDTWIVSSQSPTQKKLLNSLNKNIPIYVEGAFKVWLRSISVNYFILRADIQPKEIPVINSDDVSNLQIPFSSNLHGLIKHEKSVHEQEEGIFLATCATGTSSRDSLLSWIRLMEKDNNPILGEIPVLFTLKSPISDIVTREEEIS